MIPPALRYRSYRFLWIGLIISIMGTRMQTAAVLWHVYEISDQPIALGGVGLVTVVPILALSFIAGAAADIYNRRQLMFATQISLAMLAALLGWATLANVDSILVIYGIIAASSAVWAFDMPARQALIPNLVPAEFLSNAFSLNGIAFQLGSVVGPAAGGLLIARVGVAYAYFFNAFSFMAVILALILMGPVPQEGTSAGAKALLTIDLRSSIFEGLRFAFQHPIIFPSMVLDFFATFFSTATALLPIFAKDILSVGPVGYGWLVAAPSVGAGLIALILAFQKAIRRQGAVLFLAVAGYGFATVLFGVSRVFWLTYFALALTGATDMLSMVIRNTVRQLQTPDHLRGRMTSVNQIFFMGGPQLGELEAGLVAQWFGPAAAVVSGGIGCLMTVGLIAARSPHLRRYQGCEPIIAGGS